MFSICFQHFPLSTIEVPQHPGTDETGGQDASKTTCRNFWQHVAKGTEMRLTFIKKDPRSSLGHSPTVYITDDRTLIVQGWTLTDEKARAEMKIPAGEDAVEIPVRMVPFVVQALLRISAQPGGRG